MADQPNLLSVLEAMTALEAIGVLILDDPDAENPSEAIAFADPDADIPRFAFEMLDVLAEAGVLYSDPSSAQMYFGEPEGIDTIRITPRCPLTKAAELPTFALLEVLKRRMDEVNCRVELVEVRDDLPVTSPGRPRTKTPADDGTVSTEVFAAMCGVTESAVRDWRRYGHAPQPVNSPSRSEEGRYNRQEALAYAAEYTAVRGE